MEDQKRRFDSLKESISEQGKLISPGALLKRAALLWPDRKALICGDESVTFEQLFWRACVVATELVKYSFKQGAPVLVFYENSIDFYVAYYAVWLAGCVVVPLNVFLQDEELRHIVSDAQPLAAFVSAALHDRLRQLAPHLISISVEDFLSCTRLCEESSFAGLSLDGDALAALLYTSGTTGLPKGVMLSANGLLTNAMQAVTTLDLGAHEVVLAALPLFHSYMQNTCVWSPLLIGATVIIVPKITRRSIVEALAERPTAVLGIPQLFGLFCKLRDLDFSSVKFCFCGGDALHKPIKRMFELIYGRRLVNGYGLTEMGPLVAVNLFDGETPEYCVGMPVYGVTVVILDEHGQLVEDGSIGTVWVSGENMMMGYYKAPAATSAIMHENWLNTGDLGWITSEGRLVISGRIKDLIIRKGINIYPQEIEAVLSRYPGVLQVAVVGVLLGDEEIPCAFIMIDGDEGSSAYSELSLRSYCSDRLAFYKIPHWFIIKRSLPVTSTGKIDKKILRAEALEIVAKQKE